MKIKSRKYQHEYRHFISNSSCFPSCIPICSRGILQVGIRVSRSTQLCPDDTQNFVQIHESIAVVKKSFKDSIVALKKTLKESVASIRRTIESHKRMLEITYQLLARTIERLGQGESAHIIEHQITVEEEA
ncbi:hypothetical protein I3842_01G101600 [Carya illinoinensis]|uniref:Uncharacterized protein n=1 Tax=Carya illinoinensis TaxID=32201 RepID=A0A922K3Q4_CARIL|nr:hypothetical protein I3842_01G101600 [Carya illinoinensis]